MELTVSASVVSSAAVDVNAGAANKPGRVGILVGQLVGILLPVR